MHKTVQLSENPCYTWSRSGLIESPYIPATRTRFVQPGKIEIDANERAVIEKRNAAFSFAPSSILSLTIIPCCNPYSINTQKRFWTIDNTDINRMFPGYDLGETTQRIADGIFSQIKDYEYGIQFTSFYMPGEFIPHVRLMDEGYSDVITAMNFGMPYVVKRTVRPYDTATLNYNWQVWNTKAYSLYTSTTSRIDKKSAGQAVLSILRFCKSVGFVKYQENGDHPSIVISDKELISVRTAKSGIFEPLAKVGDSVDEGTPLAEIINPYDGSVMETLYAPRRGTLFFMHSDPITYAETAVIKMV